MKFIFIFLCFLTICFACNPKLPASLRGPATRTCLTMGFTNIINYRCFPYCFMVNMGFFINGEISADTVLQIMGPISGVKTVKAAQAKCDTMRSKGKCDFAVKLGKCYEDNDVIIFDDYLSFLNSDLVKSYFIKSNSTKS